MSQPMRPTNPPGVRVTPGAGWGAESVAAVIEGCRAGDAEAWDELITRYKALVYSIPRRHGFDKDASDEVFQEVFTILLRQLDGIRNPTGFPKWLMTTTHRTCRDLKRRKGPVIPANEVPDGDGPPQEHVLAREREQVVREGLRRLDDRCRDLLTALHGGSGPASYETIAGRLGIPVGSIGPTRARCLERLMRVLETVDRDGVL